MDRSLQWQQLSSAWVSPTCKESQINWDWTLWGGGMREGGDGQSQRSLAWELALLSREGFVAAGKLARGYSLALLEFAGTYNNLSLFKKNSISYKFGQEKKIVVQFNKGLQSVSWKTPRAAPGPSGVHVRRWPKGGEWVVGEKGGWWRGVGPGQSRRVQIWAAWFSMFGTRGTGSIWRGSPPNQTAVVNFPTQNSINQPLGRANKSSPDRPKGQRGWSGVHVFFSLEWTRCIRSSYYPHLLSINHRELSCILWHNSYHWLLDSECPFRPRIKGRMIQKIAILKELIH